MTPKILRDFNYIQRNQHLQSSSSHLDSTRGAKSRVCCWCALNAIEHRLYQPLRHFDRMQVRPVHAAAFFAQVIEGLVARLVGAAQVKRYVDQCVGGWDVRVYAEERFVAGVAAAEGAGSGAGEWWVGDYLFSHWKMLLNAATHHYHVKGVATVREVVDPGIFQSRQARKPPAHSRHRLSWKKCIRATTPDRQVIRRRSEA